MQIPRRHQQTFVVGDDAEVGRIFETGREFLHRSFLFHRNNDPLT